MIKHILAACSLVVVLGVGSLPALAQKPTSAPTATTPSAVSDAELKQFVGAAKKLEVITQERSTEISKVVKDGGLSLDRFREIYLSKQDAKVPPKTQITQDEQQRYDRTVEQLVQVQKDTQRKMGEAVQSEGLKVPRFLEILQTIQKTPSLQKRVEQMLNSSS